MKNLSIFKHTIKLHIKTAKEGKQHNESTDGFITKEREDRLVDWFGIHGLYLMLASMELYIEGLKNIAIVYLYRMNQNFCYKKYGRYRMLIHFY